MNLRSTQTIRWTLAAATACLLACVPETEEVGDVDDTGESSATTTATGGGSTSSDTLDSTTSGSGSTTATTSEESGTSATTTDATTETSTDTGSEGTTTGVELGDFERFQFDLAAGPCAPDEDCDGFIELLVDGTLNVEAFGDVTDTVVMAQVSDKDLAEAIVVFTDPALVTLLDADEPPCKPPTDIFEQMEVELDGVLYSNSVTACENPSILAARTMAMELRDTYVP